MVESINYKFSVRDEFQLIKNLFLSFAFVLIFYANVNSQSLSAEQIYQKVKDAIVVIYGYDYSDELISQGSGVILKDKGYVVTNYHVLSGCERLEIMHGDNEISYSDIVGIDVEKDILIIKINDKKFPSIKLGNINSLKVGQRVYAIGNPLGFENTISEGIISGLRSYQEIGKNYIQITASISPGSSGGAVVNDKGELIGISAATMEDGQNLNFAIPVNDILSVKIGSYAKDDSFKDFELFKKGLDTAERGYNQEAINYFTRYLLRNPYDYLAYYNRGTIKSRIKDYREAIQDLNRAIEINPNYANAYYNRGTINSDLGFYQKAIQDYNKAIEINPFLGDAYFNCGFLKGKLEDYRGAIQDYNKAIEVNPNQADVFYNRGIMKNNLEDYKGALRDFDNAIDINPNFAQAYNYRGIIRNILEDYNWAIQDFNRAIEIDADNYQAYYNRGLAKNNLKDYRAAIQDFNQAIQINPYVALIYVNRGTAKHFLGDNTGACLDWSKAGELGCYEAYEIMKVYCH